MKLWIAVWCVVTINFALAAESVEKKSIGKPRINAFFMDTDVIQLLPGETKTLDIKIQVESDSLDNADSINYEIYSSEGLQLEQLSLSDKTRNGELIIPIKIKVDQQGRFYIHVQLVSVKDGVETRGVISRVVSSESSEESQMLKKQTSSGEIRLLPAVETIKKASNE